MQNQAVNRSGEVGRFCNGKFFVAARLRQTIWQSKTMGIQRIGPMSEREDSTNRSRGPAFRFSTASMLALTILVAIICSQQLWICRLQTKLFYVQKIRELEEQNRQLEARKVRIQNQLAQMHTGTSTRFLNALVHHRVTDASDETTTEPPASPQVPEP